MAELNPGLPPILRPWFAHALNYTLGVYSSGVDQQNSNDETIRTGLSTELSRCYDKFHDDESDQDFAWILSRVDRHTNYSRLAAMLTLRARLRGAKRMMDHSGYSMIGQYGLFPNVERPVLVFQLFSPASSYAVTHLLPKSPYYSLAGTAKTILRPCLGLDPSIVGVMTIGRRARGEGSGRAGPFKDYAQTLKGVIPEKPTSVACVSQTNPTYLVFGVDPHRPVCVVQYGDINRLWKLYHNLKKLHLLMPDWVPTPIYFAKLNNNWSVLVQEGIKGMTIHRILNQTRGHIVYRELQHLALKALAELHLVIAQVPDWRVRVSPGDELRRVMRLCRAVDMPLSSRVYDQGEAWSRKLDELGEIESFFQHGDFGLGNLIVNGSRLSIIDFEEFGVSAMPLLDVLSLAFSFHHFGKPKQLCGALNQDIADCLGSNPVARTMDNVFTHGMILHFVLWKVLQGWGRRETLVARFLSHAERLAETPKDFF